jgi:hypothetical protein
MTILIRQAASMRKEDLDQLGPVKIPLSSTVSQLTGRKYIDEIPGIDSMGRGRADRHPRGRHDLVSGELDGGLGNYGRRPQGLCDHRPAGCFQTGQDLAQGNVRPLAPDAGPTGGSGQDHAARAGAHRAQGSAEPLTFEIAGETLGRRIFLTRGRANPQANACSNLAIVPRETPANELP